MFFFCVRFLNSAKISSMLKLPRINLDASRISRFSEGEEIMMPSSRSCTPPESKSRDSSSNDMNCASTPLLPTLSQCPSVSSEHTGRCVASQDSLDSPFFVHAGSEGNLVAADITDHSSRAQRLLKLATLESQQVDQGAALLKSSKNPQFPSSSIQISPLLSPLVISPFQSFSRNSSMSPSSVPLRNLKCLEISFPDSRPYSPGETNEASSLNLRKKALTPMNLLRGMSKTPSPGHHHCSPKNMSLPPMSINSSSTSPSSFFSTTPHNAYHSNNISCTWCATTRSVDSAMTDEEVQETVKQAIALALEEQDEAIEEDESETIYA